MHCSLKYISVFVTGILMGFFVHQPQIQLQPAVEVYKEVAHIPATQFSNGTLIYTDSENDVSYYVATDRLQTMKPGDNVTTDNGESLTIKLVDLRGFYVDTTDVNIRAGMSGSPIWYDNEIVGYVSSLRDSNTLYCIWAN